MAVAWLRGMVAAAVAPRLAAGPDRWVQPAWRAIAAEVAPPSGALLDLDAHHGWLCVQAAADRPDLDAIGLVGDPWRFALAERVREGRLNVTFKQADPVRLAWPAATFDAAVAVNSPRVWGQSSEVLAEVWRVLRPGAALFVYDAGGGGGEEAQAMLPNSVARRWMRRGALGDDAWAALKDAVRASPFGGGEEGVHGAFRRLVVRR
jgi:SAM-dependent methyltransferase